MVRVCDGASGMVAGPVTGRDANSVGAERSVRDARSVVGARGMMSSWPLRTCDLIERLFASARSVRLTPSLRAMVVRDSPPLTIYHFNAFSSAGEASASFD